MLENFAVIPLKIKQRGPVLLLGFEKGKVHIIKRALPVKIYLQSL